MKEYLLAGAVLLVLASCGGNRSLESLAEVEGYISDEPERALAVLDSLEGTGLRGGEAEAKFALLYSMAMDKNWIDVADDSLINVAVRRYSRRGSADERLKAYYYQGRVYQNGGDDEAAMESFVKAEASAPDAEDGVAKGMLYRAMAYIYASIFDLERGEEYAGYAAECYRKAGDIDKYAETLTFLLSIFYALGEREEALARLDTVKAMMPDLTESVRNEYYTMAMSMKNWFDDDTGLSEVLAEYLREFGEHGVSWLDVAESYTTLGRFDDAEEMLRLYRENNPDYMNAAEYFLNLYYLYESSEDYKKAFDALKRYSRLSDSLSVEVAAHDTGFMKERYEKELRLEKARSSRTVIVFVAVFGMLLLSYVVYMLWGRLRRKNAEAASYRENLARLNQEKEELSAMIADNPPVDRQSMKVLRGRLELLNRILAAEISPGSERDRKVGKELEQLVANREEFLYATRMTFAAAHPRFITALESRGLTEAEVEYCCLYAIGLRGKDISAYVGHGGHYNESSAIRSKLGLGPHDTNLGNYLRSML
ncbi:MAG TPA: hypothetical protein IAC86_08220 [Candidatus Cryptobacteroides excrementigallinarum]|nr:hypothetical protein [Candidatus Cryptobacteroides excrementigallinarum]